MAAIPVPAASNSFHYSLTLLLSFELAPSPLMMPASTVAIRVPWNQPRSL
jgi:hypothetical protein